MNRKIFIVKRHPKWYRTIALF